jgi:hypothetical protein
MPFTLKPTHPAPEIKIGFDQNFDTDRPMDHIHGAILNLCNAGFDRPRTRAGLRNLVINLSTVNDPYSNIALFFRNALADGEIAFRPDTPIHANNEGRYPGGTLQDRLNHRARHFEFGAVGGGMRVVFDHETDELYISAHYSYPGRLTADAGSVEEDWLLTTKARLSGECDIMIDHSTGKTREQREEIEKLRAKAAEGRDKGLFIAPGDVAAKADALERTLRIRATRNRAFNTWLHDPQAFMPAQQRLELYGI